MHVSEIVETRILPEAIGGLLKLFKKIPQGLSFAERLKERRRALEFVKADLAQVPADKIDDYFQEWLRLTRSVDANDPRNKQLVDDLEDIGKLITIRTDQIRLDNNIKMVLDGSIPYMLDSKTGKIVARPLQYWPSWAKEAWQEIINTKGDDEAQRILNMITKKIQDRGPN
jgi:hypothetical protein